VKVYSDIQVLNCSPNFWYRNKFNDLRRRLGL